MKIIFFWILFGILVVLFITQMITVIPLLKKGTSQDEKQKHQPAILICNALMIIFAGILLMIGSKETGAFACGTAILAIGIQNLFFAILKIRSFNKKDKE